MHALSQEKKEDRRKLCRRGSNIPLSRVFLLLIRRHLHPHLLPSPTPQSTPQSLEAEGLEHRSGEWVVCVKLAFKILPALIYQLCCPERLLSPPCLDLLYNMSRHIPISVCSVSKALQRS